MINHIRTLLFNRTQEGYPLTFPGEEYIAPTFVPRKLTSSLRTAHTTLFGKSPDRLYMNYRMRQIMQIMHSSPLADDLLLQDSRITYLPFRDELFNDAFTVGIEQLFGEPKIVHVAGTHEADNGSGRLQQIWDIETVNTGVVTITQRRQPNETTTETFDGQTPVILPGSTFKAYLYNTVPGDLFRVTSNALPTQNISDVLVNLEAAFGERGVQEVFPALPEEPVKTWKKIWFETDNAMMRYTALLLAMATKISQLPQEG